MLNSQYGFDRMLGVSDTHKDDCNVNLPYSHRFRKCTKHVYIAGEDFDVKQFHRVILELGPAPLEVVEEEVLAWIDASLVSGADRTAFTSLHLLIILIYAAVSYI